MPPIANRTWPPAWLCQCERAPGSKVTYPTGILNALSGSINCCTQTIPVKFLAGARWPFGKMASVSDLFSVRVWAFTSNLAKLTNKAVRVRTIVLFFIELFGIITSIPTFIHHRLDPITCVKTVRPASASNLPTFVSINESACFSCGSVKPMCKQMLR